MEGVNTLETVKVSGEITLKCLGLTKENKVWAELVSKMFKIQVISFPALNIPSYYFQRDSISA